MVKFRDYLINAVEVLFIVLLIVFFLINLAQINTTRVGQCALQSKM